MSQDMCGYVACLETRCVCLKTPHRCLETQKKHQRTGATRGWLIRCPRAANLPYVRLRLKKNIFTRTRVTQDLYNASYTPTSDFLSGVFAPRAPSSTYCEVLYPQVTPHAGMVPGVTSDVLVSRAGSAPGRRGVVVRRCELEL